MREFDYADSDMYEDLSSIQMREDENLPPDMNDDELAGGQGCGGDTLNNDWDDPAPEPEPEDRRDTVVVWGTWDIDGITRFLDMWNWINPTQPIDLAHLIEGISDGLGDIIGEPSDCATDHAGEPGVALAGLFEANEFAEFMIQLESDNGMGNVFPGGDTEYNDLGLFWASYFEYRAAANDVAAIRAAIAACEGGATE